MNPPDAPPPAAGVLPHRGVLLHIGPPKTGTTAVQHSLSAARDRLADLGILYPGKRPSHWHASCAVMGRSGTTHPADPPVPMRRWDRLVARVAARTDRAVVSSEGFADADATTSRRVIEDLGGDDVSVLITMRALGAVLPSTWQQDLKAGAPVPLPGRLSKIKSRVVKPYDEWVKEILADRNGRSVFWQRNDYAALVRRWVGLVGRERVVVVVVAPNDPDRILRDTEHVLAIPPRTLEHAGKTNRSLSRQEVELVREWLVRLESAQPLAPDRYHAWIRRGGLWGLVEGRRPGPGETPLTTPAWAWRTLQDRTDQIVAGLRDSGVLVIGSLDDLDSSEPARHDAPVPTWVPNDVAIELLMGLVSAADQDLRGGADSGPTGRQLRATLAARLSGRHR